MNYNFTSYKIKVSEIEQWFSKELAGIHTGRAAANILDSIMVESYGTRTSVSHIAAISNEDAKTLRVSPWDKGQIKSIEKAINEANLGISASSDDAGIRIHFPELTTERRTLLSKILKQKMEDAKVSLRGEREKVWNDIQNKEKKGEIPEDDKFRFKEELQKITDDANKKFEAISTRKEKDIMG